MKWKYDWDNWGLQTYTCKGQCFSVQIMENLSLCWDIFIEINNETVFVRSGASTKDEAIRIAKSVLWKINDDIYGQISAKDEFEQE